MCRVCVRQCIWKRELRGVKIQSDEIPMERRAGFAHVAPNYPNLAQGVGGTKENKKTQEARWKGMCRNIVATACVNLLEKGVCHSRRSKGVCYSGLIVF